MAGLFSCNQKKTAPREAQKTIKPGAERWLDTDGQHINAHGGGIYIEDDTYYWFGEHKIAGEEGNRAMVGVQVYSSKNLTEWTNEGVALAVHGDTKSMLQKGSTIERPKVIYNDKTGKYVMWFHHELKGKGYEAALAGVATADKVTGPYTYLTSRRLHPGVYPKNFTLEQQQLAATALKDTSLKRPELGRVGAYLVRDYEGGQMSRDMTLFKDADGTAYHITASEENQTLHVSELTDDFTKVTDNYVRILPGKRNEAPAVFKKDSTYYLISSGLTGWKPNPARSAKAPTIFGPWEELGNPVRGSEEDLKKTFRSQSTYVIPVLGKQNAFIFMGDRWAPKNPIDGTYVWLPIKFEEENPTLRWLPEWDLSEFD
ncbi:glycoside hydrolase family 43 protein [Lewinella sp. 4G2]|uniref:glycoside hydrolase family 43 protein n=1 Tax=Lewinella sp. 4G2 TaxID=1803372 RepID=UPI0018D48DA9|nr:glycoside hydrolase family 43 protein [Lewinella sp. 4G2]